MYPFEFTEKIRVEIIDSGVDDRYKVGAYGFVLRGLDFYLTKISEKRHVSGQELSWALLTFAHKQFGPMAKSVFDRWGIKATSDLGCIVYNMIRIGMLGKQPNDSLDDFYDVTDVMAFFDKEDKTCFTVDRTFIRGKK